MVFMVVCSWCVRWWWLFSCVCRALVCRLAVGGVYLACGACGVHELACVWSECVFFWSACRVSVCYVRVLRVVRVFVSLLVEQGRDESSLSW